MGGDPAGLAQPWRSPVLAVLLALPFIPFFIRHPDGAFEVLAMLMVLGAGVRLGLAGGGWARHGAIASAFLIVVCAFLTLSWGPAWLAAGLGVLALWSLAAHLRSPAAHRPRVPFGVVWPLAVGVMVVWFG